jgi:hypothetical protein
VTVDAHALVGTHDVLFVTLDTLRHDAACLALERGLTPNLGRLLPGARWELRHSPGSFTFSAHQAFFAGFLPTPARPGRHERLFALAFPGSETTGTRTCVLEAPDIVTGLRACGYYALGAGGVGFFNELTPLGRVLPSLFDEHRWCDAFGVTDPASTEHQVAWLCERIASVDPSRRLFTFLNVSAIHQPNRHYLEGADQDGIASQIAALAYVDGALPPLLEALCSRAAVLAIICSDHGTAYGEDGYVGHRLGHPVVWEVPYAEMVLPRRHDSPAGDAEA